MLVSIAKRARHIKLALRTPMQGHRQDDSLDVLQPVISPFRVLPHELDWRDHLPNYAFFRFAEMNINKWSYVTGVNERADYDVWILAASQVVFLRQIKAFQRFHVKTHVMHWDRKYAYFQHEFIVNYGKKTQARAVVLLSKLVFMHNGKQTQPHRILGNRSQENEHHPVIASWLANQADIKTFFS